jgi:hypothetical protein
MDLKAATDQDIQREIKRREMVRKDEKIMNLFKEITIAYNSGKISSISVDERHLGTSVASTCYHIFLK